MTERRVISSRRNPRVAAAAKLHRPSERHRRGLTLLEGPHLIAEAIGAGARLEEVFTLEGSPLPSAEDSSIDVVVVTRPVLERLAGTRTPTGPIAVVEVPPSPALDLQPTVVFCGVADPGNAGTLIRTAAALGFQVVSTHGSVDLWAPKVLRAAAGGHFHTRLVELDQPLQAALDDVGLTGVALVAHGGDSLDTSVAGVPALLVGGEAHGLGADALAAAEHFVTIEIGPAIESLNAAVAGAIAMYQYR